MLSTALALCIIYSCGSLLAIAEKPNMYGRPLLFRHPQQFISEPSTPPPRASESTMQTDSERPNPTPADLQSPDLDSTPPAPIDDATSQNTFPEMFFLPSDARQRIRNTCQKKRDCKGQKSEHTNRRAMLKELRSKSLQKNRGKRKGWAKHQADALVESNFNKAFEVKKALYDFWGVLDVADPADDGVCGGDTFLNNRQLDSLLQSIDLLRNAGSKVRVPRSALHFEDASFEIQFWSTMPIPYFVDLSTGITSTQRAVVRTALSEISNSTKGRITFKELSATVDSPYLEYENSPYPGICGASSVGQQDSDNTVYLNFNCKAIYGTIIHETIHALGGAHHHTRLDRDTYLTINWDNMDPSCLDAMALNDMNMFTTYGTNYSYGSIMHYSSTVCAMNSTVPTLTPKRSLPSGIVMGQRNGLSQTDIDLLNRIYCCRNTLPNRCPCRDTSVYCGYDANIGYCIDRRYKTWMTQNCAKSCGICSCT